MRTTQFTIFALTLTWVLSPETLIRLGNGVGLTGAIYFFAMVFAAITAGFAASFLRNTDLVESGQVTQVDVLNVFFGKTIASSLIIATRCSLALLIPTGLLVTAGFTFNEVFVYWFPNFGFAFLLLGVVVVIHHFGESVVKIAQGVFIAVVILAFVPLIAWGLATSPEIATEVTNSGSVTNGPVILGALLVFLGYDLTGSQKDSREAVGVLGALLFSLALFTLWGWLSLHHVAQNRLADTTIPYIITAREILGQPGRYLMGGIIICGVAAAVNGLFLMATTSLGQLSNKGLLPGHPKGDLRRRRFVLLLALVIGVFMARGLAGYEILETYIFASLLLWLLLISLHCLATASLLGRQGKPGFWRGYIPAVVYGSAMVYLVVASDETWMLLRFIAVVLAISAGASFLWCKGKSARNVQINNLETKGEL